GLASWVDGKLTDYPELAGHSVNTLVADRDGTVWAGGYLGGIGRGQTATGTVCAIKNGSARGDTSAFGQWVGSLYEDGDGRMWATAQTGLWRLRPGTRKHYPIPMSAITSLQTFNEDGASGLLIADENGMRQLVEEKVVPYQLPGVPSGFKPGRALRDR